MPGLTRQTSRAEDVAAFERIRAPEYNPFVNSTDRMPCTQIVKMIVVGTILLPIRLVLTVLNMLLGALVCGIAVCGLTDEDLERPLAPWRWAVTRVLFFVVRFQLFIFGYYWLDIRGTPANKAAAGIVVSNHVTFVEPLAIWLATGGTALSAIENKHIPVVGRMLKAMQTIFVDRRAKNNSGVKARIAARATDGRMPQVLIFPEGTCSNGRRVVSFKAGAFEPGVPVQPVAVRYNFQYFDPSWPVVSPGLGGLLLRTYTQVFNSITITFLPVHVPTEEEKRSPRLFAQHVQAEIAAALGVQVTQHSFDDVQLAQVALKSRYPAADAVVELMALRSALNIDLKLAKLYLQRFIRLDEQRTGELTFSQFCEFVASLQPALVTSPKVDMAPSPGSAPDKQPLPAASRRYSQVAPTTPVVTASGAKLASVEELRHLFTLLDMDDSGTLNFREFLVGLAIVNEQGVGQRKDAIRLAFKVMDVDEDGKLSREELQRTLQRVFPEMTAEQFEQRFHDADANQDGMVGYHEFEQWATRHPDTIPLVRRTFLGFSDELALASPRPDAASPTSPGSDVSPLSEPAPPGGGGVTTSVEAALSPASAAAPPPTSAASPAV